MHKCMIPLTSVANLCMNTALRVKREHFKVNGVTYRQDQGTLSMKKSVVIFFVSFGLVTSSSPNGVSPVTDI